jgi:STE24 endopeptidase
MHAATPTFIAALLLGAALRTALAARQLRHLAAHRDAVPRAFAAAVSAEAHARAADYTAARVAHGLAALALGTLLAIGWTLGGGLAALDAAWHGAGLGPLATGTAVLVSFALIGELIELPLELRLRFGVEARFGFNRTTPARFAADALKGALLTVVLGGALAAAALALMAAAPANWWLWVWALVVATSVLMSWAWPTLIAPWFNRFAPLPEGELRGRVEALLARCGFRSEGVFVMDASSRSAHGNAYFTGVGSAKRIVLFDTLLERLAPDEVEAVLAHELGHFRLRHVAQRLVLSAVGTLVLLWCAAQLAADPTVFAALGVPQPSAHAALVLLMLVAPPLLLPLKPLGAWWSRRHEFEADDYARQHSDGAALARALVALYRDNATTLTPDPWYSAFHDSHPPPAARLARLGA